jgi:tetratricopeptide (TPR) repeat protein
MSVGGFIITFHPFHFLPQEAAISHSDDFGFDSTAADLEERLVSKDPLIRAGALREKAIGLLEENGTDSTAPIFLEESLRLYEGANAVGELGLTAWWLGLAYGNSKQYDRALEIHLKGADYARQVMDDVQELFNVQSIAFNYKSTKQHGKAVEYYGMAYELAKSTNSDSVAMLRYFYIRSLRKVSKYGLAAQLARESVEAGRESGEDYPIVMGDQELAAILMEQGDFEGALAAATEAHNVAVFVQQPREAERAQFNKAKALNLLGRHGEALVELTEIQLLKRYRSRNKHRLRVDFEVAKAKAGIGERAVAAEMFKRVVALFDSFNVRDTAVEAMFQQAMNYMAMGNDLDAEMVLGTVLERLSAAEPSVLSRTSSVLLGGIFMEREQWERVVSIYEPLDADPTNRFSVWYPNVLQSLAMAYFKLGRMDDADAAAATVLATGLQVDPALNVGDSLAVRAGVALAAGNVAAARRFGRKAIKTYLAGGFASKAAPLGELYL